MKHRFVLMYLVTLALAAFGAPKGTNTFSVGDGRVPDFSKYKLLKSSLKHHARETRSDYSTIPGSVIHWYSDGHAETNVIRHLDMKVQTNSYEQVLIRTDEEAKVTRDVKDKASKAYKKDSKTFDNWIKDTEKAMSKTSSQEMKDFYQSILDISRQEQE